MKRLFSLEKTKPYLTFKGGTSLSKVYGLIDRFSEDIDLSIEREFFGFGEPHNPENAPSKKKQNAIIDNLSKACSNYVQSEMLTSLKEAFAAKLGTTDGWQIFSDPEDPDALMFKCVCIFLVLFLSILSATSDILQLGNRLLPKFIDIILLPAISS